MRKGKKALIILGCILAVILITVCICTIIANSKNDKTKPNIALSYWQDMIIDDALIKNIVIPGAHDSGTNGLPYFTETQDKTIKDQLLCGTRYFDLRISHSDNKLRIYHGPSKGVFLDGILDDVTTFLQANPSETLILDFQHFENGETAQPKTLTMLEEKLNGLLVTNDTTMSDVEFINSITLGQIRGKALVVWGVENNAVLSKNYIFKRNNDSGTRAESVIHSYYQTSLNTKSSSKYITEALPHYIESYKNVNSGLFVLQGQLTDGMYIFGPRFREATHTNNMNEYVSALNASDDLASINIIIRDFVSPKKNCITLQLNIAKGLVKENRITEYNSVLQGHIEK